MDQLLLLPMLTALVGTTLTSTTATSYFDGSWPGGSTIGVFISHMPMASLKHILLEYRLLMQVDGPPTLVSHPRSIYLSMMPMELLVQQLL
ncbi:hypothetical protein AMTRI_Chr10g228180 [Amborella trichopoda]